MWITLAAPRQDEALTESPQRHSNDFKYRPHFKEQQVDLQLEDLPQSLLDLCLAVTEGDQ